MDTGQSAPGQSPVGLVVAGVDGSELSRAAAVWAATQAVRHGTGLHIVHASGADVPDGHVPDARPADVEDGQAQDDARDDAQEGQASGRRILAGAAAAIRLAQPDLAVSLELAAGTAAEVLRGAAESALMTVVGAHGSDQFEDVMLGSVAAGIVGRANRPVVVAWPDPGTGLIAPDGPVVVGLDGSADSEVALAFAIDEAQLRRAPLIAVHAWDIGPLDHLVDAVLPDIRRRVQAREQRELDDQLAGWAKRYPDVELVPLLRESRPLGALLLPYPAGEPHPAPGLIVVGSQGRGRWAGLLLGSTSQALIGFARCPVAVVRTSSG